MAETALKGVGQVIFLNSVRSGSILLGSLAIGDPYLAVLAATGTLTSTALAQTLSLNSNSTSNGLLSYNGCLMGCAVAVFVAPYHGGGDPATLVSALLSTALPATITGAAAATVATASLGSVLQSPQWTYAFNLVALTMLLRLQPLALTSLSDTLADPAVTAAAVSVVANEVPVLTPAWALAPLTGLSQIFVVESPLTGLGLVAGIATYSPRLAIHALLGSTMGCLTGWFLGAPVSDLAAGLWGYNSALTSLGIGVFFVNTRGTWALSVAGAAATAGVFGALQPVLGAIHTPCLTLPFCLTMTGCYHLAGTSPHWILATDPRSPEQNQSP